MANQMNISDPWFAFAKEHHFADRIEVLWLPAQVSLAAANVERALPLYMESAQQHDSEGAQRVRSALDTLWHWQESGRTDAVEPAHQSILLYSEELLGEGDSPAETQWVSDADANVIRVIDALSYGLGAALPNESSRSAARVTEALCAAFWARDNPHLANPDNLGVPSLVMGVEPLLAADPAAYADLVYQSKAIEFIEQTRQPLSLHKAVELSKEVGPYVAPDHRFVEMIFERVVRALHHQPVDHLELARMLARRGQFTQSQGDLEAARADYEEARSLFRQLGDTTRSMTVKKMLGSLT